MSKNRVNKKSIEEDLAKLNDKIELLQEPVHRVFEAIGKLMDKTKETKNLELIKFKLELSKITEKFLEEMVDIHDRLIEDFEQITGLKSEQ